MDGSTEGRGRVKEMKKRKKKRIDGFGIWKGKAWAKTLKRDRIERI